MIALDVGTRSIICAQYNEPDERANDGRATPPTFATITRIVHTEHTGPCMREGNVYDMNAVVESVRGVREKMELPIGTKVSIAIAGGNLVALRHVVKLEGRGDEPWTETDLLDAEEQILRETDRPTTGILVGLMRTSFRVKDMPVGSLLGMEGSASYEILATYISMDGIRSKFFAIEGAGFLPERIVVEPLAVSQAIFGGGNSNSPGAVGGGAPELFAVIDIGAGTSDIAIVSPDGIIGAASIPVAGDTITGAISRALGLSYRDADGAKRNSSDASAALLRVTDIWGERRQYSTKQIHDAAKDGVEELVENLASELKRLLSVSANPNLKSKIAPQSGVTAQNPKSQRALFGIILVGGGSLWPDLAERIAKKTGLDPDRVRVRNAETIPTIEDKTGQIKGPMFLTTIGIILSRRTAFSTLHYHLNGKRHLAIQRVSESGSKHKTDKRGFSIADALVDSGDDPLNYFGEPGEASGELDGGSPGHDPVVTRNGRRGTLDDVVENGDTILVMQGASGDDACRIDHHGDHGVHGENSNLFNLRELSELSGEQALSMTGMSTEIKSEVKPAEPEKDSKGYITINGNKVYCGERFRFETGGDGSVTAIENEPPLLDNILNLPVKRAISIKVNGQDHFVKDMTKTALVNGKRVNGRAMTPWSAEINSEKASWRLYEVLQGTKNVSVAPTVNGKPATFTTEIREGDEVIL